MYVIGLVEPQNAVNPVVVSVFTDVATAGLTIALVTTETHKLGNVVANVTLVPAEDAVPCPNCIINPFGNLTYLLVDGSGSVNP